MSTAGRIEVVVIEVGDGGVAKEWFLDDSIMFVSYIVVAVRGSSVSN